MAPSVNPSSMICNGCSPILHSVASDVPPSSSKRYRNSWYCYHSCGSTPHPRQPRESSMCVCTLVLCVCTRVLCVCVCLHVWYVCLCGWYSIFMVNEITHCKCGLAWWINMPCFLSGSHGISSPSHQQHGSQHHHKTGNGIALGLPSECATTPVMWMVQEIYMRIRLNKLSFVWKLTYKVTAWSTSKNVLMIHQMSNQPSALAFKCIFGVSVEPDYSGHCSGQATSIMVTIAGLGCTSPVQAATFLVSW